MRLYHGPRYLALFDDCPDPTAKPDSNVTYKVVVMDSQGCMDEGIIEVRIRKKINVFIPNVISPTQDVK
ncbi:MAG: hypothetical protein IPN87_17105 [Saprospiraceae bacterium]|nr:hypothetical protein [Candidatus Brachybacter algidus]